MRTARFPLGGIGMSVDDVVCAGGPRRRGPEEPVVRHAIVLPRRGVFVRWVGARAYVAEPTQVLFFARGEAQRVAHPAGGDACTAIGFQPDALERLIGIDRWPGVAAQAPTTAALDLAHRRLLLELRAGARGLPVEEAALELAARLLAHARARLPRSTAGARRRRQLVEGARELLATRVGREPSLGALADELGCSPFHLSRTFRAETGVPLRVHVLHLRLREALERISDGTRDLTDLALALGFCDHAHLSRAFAERLGLSPSVWRRLSAPRA